MIAIIRELGYSDGVTGLIAEDTYSTVDEKFRDLETHRNGTQWYDSSDTVVIPGEFL